MLLTSKFLNLKFDMLRVVCLHAQGPSLLLKHAEISNVLSMVFASVAHRLSFVASLRLVQNLLLVGSDAALASSPLDVSTGKLEVLNCSFCFRLSTIDLFLLQQSLLLLA